MSNLDKITATTLIVWGKQDAVPPGDQARFAKERIPNSQLYIFDHCGHMPNFEKPEEFNRLVLEFLSKTEKRHIANQLDSKQTTGINKIRV